MSFAGSLRLPLDEPILHSGPRTRTSRIADDDWVPRCSDRLAAKSAFRDPQTEKQAKRVLLSKWTRRPEGAASTTPNEAIARRFRETFTTPLSSSKRAQCASSTPGALAAARGLLRGCSSRDAPVIAKQVESMSANHPLVWNARGLNSRARRSAVRSIVEQQRASIVCLQESKIENFSVSMNCDVSGIDFDFQGLLDDLSLVEVHLSG